MGGENLDHVAAHAERAAVEVAGRALVLQRHEIGDELALVDALALLERERHRRIGLDRADAVDARHRGHDDDVVALEQRAGRAVAHAVDLLVDRGFLLDIGIGARHVGLGLVVVVIADEVLDRVVGEEAPELAVELGRERLVGREHQRRPLRRFDHLRHGEGLARSGDAEQHLRAVLAADSLHEVGDRLRLVARGREVRLDHQPVAALGFFRPRRPVRRPRPLAEFGAAFAQQRLQRLHRGGRAGDAAKGRELGAFPRRPGLLPPAFGGGRGALVLVAFDTPRLRQIGIERADRRLAGVASLRRLAETLRGGFARAVGGGEIGAAVERIVRRRLEPGLRARPRGALADAGIEQVRERGVGRRRVRPRRLGARRPRGILLGMLGRIARGPLLALRHVRRIGSFRHRRNMASPL